MGTALVLYQFPGKATANRQPMPAIIREAGRAAIALDASRQCPSGKLAYPVPLPASVPVPTSKPPKEIRIFDPATGTMHFGLVAFELLAEMCRQELINAGTPGWPAQASVQHETDIHGAILANNLFGIDIALRTMQLAAAALYLKTKSANKNAILTESNLAWADVAIFRGRTLIRSQLKWHSRVASQDNSLCSAATTWKKRARWGVRWCD